MVSWLAENAWLASWLTLGGILVMEGSIFYLIWRYLRGFLGGASKDELRALRWKFKTLGQMSTADKARYKEETGEEWK